MDLNLRRILDLLTGSPPKNNIRSTGGSVTSPKNNIRDALLTKKAQDAAVDSFENYVMNEDLKKAQKKFRIIRRAAKHANALRMSPAGIATMYGGAVIKSMMDSRERKKTRKESKELQYRNMLKPLPPVQMPNSRPFGPEMYAP